MSNFLKAGQSLKRQVFSASGTWIRPAGVDSVLVTGVGAGGGGGGQGGGTCGGGGGSCEYKERVPVSV